jgi:NAD(P)-dependent dehydrogenase (short-subunit alcohol dehydrogenase family)
MHEVVGNEGEQKPLTEIAVSTVPEIQESQQSHRTAPVVTGASQGIAAALVQSFKNRNYCVIALSRSIKPSTDPNVVTV